MLTRLIRVRFDLVYLYVKDSIVKCCLFGKSDRPLGGGKFGIILCKRMVCNIARDVCAFLRSYFDTRYIRILGRFMDRLDGALGMLIGAHLLRVHMDHFRNSRSILSLSDRLRL